MIVEKRNPWLPYILLAPALLMLAIFVVYPMIMNVLLSFKNVSLLKTDSNLVGFENYIKLFSDKRVWSAVQRTFVWTALNVGGALLLGLGAALLLNARFEGSNVIKLLILVPWVLPSVITGYIWALMFQEDAGIVTYILKTLNIVSKDFSWFRTGPLSMAAAIMANIWRAFPFFSLMIYAKLSTVPHDYIEAAALEGVKPYQMFHYVLYPYIKTTVLTCLYLCFIWTFNAYDILKIMTNGGPAELTTTMSIMVQREAFQFYEISNASTMSVLMFCLMIALLIVAKIIVQTIKRGKNA